MSTQLNRNAQIAASVADLVRKYTTTFSGVFDVMTSTEDSVDVTDAAGSSFKVPTLFYLQKHAGSGAGDSSSASVDVSIIESALSKASGFAKESKIAAAEADSAAKSAKSSLDLVGAYTESARAAVKEAKTILANAKTGSVIHDGSGSTSDKAALTEINRKLSGIEVEIATSARKVETIENYSNQNTVDITNMKSAVSVAENLSGQAIEQSKKAMGEAKNAVDIAKKCQSLSDASATLAVDMAKLDKSVEEANDAAAAAKASESNAANFVGLVEADIETMNVIKGKVQKVVESAASSAASAKDNADRAERAANRAEQIVKSHPSDGGGDELNPPIVTPVPVAPVNMVPVPAPDIDIPLNNDLQIRQGFGGDVQLKGKTIARFVSFRRMSVGGYFAKDGRFKTAEVNEPRFEFGGLAIDRSTTNLIPISNIYTKQYAYAWPGNFVSVEPTMLGNAFKITGGGLVSIGDKFGAVQLPPGTYTVSFFSTAKSPIKGDFMSGGDAVTGDMEVRYFGQGWYRHFRVFTLTKAGTLRFYLSCDDGKHDSYYVTAPQCEKGAFCSSYIETNGATVSRATDYAWVDGRNFPDLPEITIAFEGDSCSHSNGTYFCRAASEQTGIVVRTASDGGVGIARGNTVAESESSSSLAHVVRINHGVMSAFSSRGGRVDSQTDAFSINSLCSTATLGRIGDADSGEEGMLCGHIRNLRVWFRALSDEQIKQIL